MESKTLRILMEEKLVFTRELIIKVPKNTSLDEITSVMSVAERESDFASDVSSSFISRIKGSSIIEDTDYDTDSPRESELEIIDWMEVDREE